MKMPTADDIRLACGELTAQEMRTAKAVLTWFIATRSSEADQRDAARLAFIIRTDVHLFPNAGPISGAGLFCIYQRKGEEWVNVSGDHADPRKAIDAAMSAQSDTEESK